LVVSYRSVKNYADSIGEQIETFVTGNQRIAKKRLYTSPESGGLGLFDITNFLDSQKVAWIARAESLDEIWKVRIYLSGCGSILNTRCSLIDRSTNPILYGIVHAYEIFLAGFTKHNENFWQSTIFENRSLFLQLRQKTLLTAGFFDVDFFLTNKRKIFSLTVMDFFENKDTYKSWESFVLSTDLQINREEYNDLKKLASNAKLKYSKKSATEIKTTALMDFINRKVKGCKRYRKKIILYRTT
jgi:hypothetical protein